MAKNKTRRLRAASVLQRCPVCHQDQRFVGPWRLHRERNFMRASRAYRCGCGAFPGWCLSTWFAPGRG